MWFTAPGWGCFGMGLLLLREGQMARISRFFPLAHGVPRVDDRRVMSGIVYVIKHGRRTARTSVAFYLNQSGLSLENVTSRRLNDEFYNTGL